MRLVRGSRLLAAIVTLCAAAAGAAELGTLFHTPEERERLDRLRRGETPAAVAAPRTGPPEVTGYVQRSDGRSTVWIDGIAVPVESRRATPLFDPKAVRAYADRKDEDLKVERKAAR
jgi:hypothetical protein